jgi:hypothetical protein
MKYTFAAVMAVLALAAGTAPALAQVAGSTVVAVGHSVVELRQVASGWSAKKQILGHPVVNENGETVGKIDDVIVAPDGARSFAIGGAGGFWKLRRHDVAIPVGMLDVSQEDTVLLRGATREMIKALPAFEYAR